MEKGVRYIAVAGNIGSGKSSLVDFLCRYFDLKPFFEPNEQNPYLKDFYADMKRWAFHSQLFFLASRFRHHKELDEAKFSGTVVQDRTIYEDAEIFARNLYNSRYIIHRDYTLYADFYSTILRSINPPDLMLYLRAPVRTIRRRIRLRARPEEQEIPAIYLRKLNKLYEQWFSRYDRSPTMVIETAKLDYITDLVDRIDLLKGIERYLKP